MSILRNDVQIELNKLHVAILKSADHYRHAADLVSDSSVSDVFDHLSMLRISLAQETENAIRRFDDLPSIPSIGQESYEQVFQQFEAMLSNNEVSSLINQKLESEIELEKMLNASKMRVIDDKNLQLRRTCLNSVVHAKEQLRMAQASISKS